MNESSGQAIREKVRERYGRLGSQPRLDPDGALPMASPCGTGADGGCCGHSPGASCCGTSANLTQLGYTPDDLTGVPAGANLGLGCGNPTALSSLRPGETVLDLGSGGGLDCFIAAKRVGPTGHVIGVDMTPEMLSRARSNAATAKTSNVEFRLGEIEHLPVPDRSVDVVISNCVINLVLDKGEVYREIFRVLRPGGRVSISDVVATRPIPDEARNDPVQWSGCSSGALHHQEVRGLLESTGFVDIVVELAGGSSVPRSLEAQDTLGVVSASIRATRPDLAGNG